MRRALIMTVTFLAPATAALAQPPAYIPRPEYKAQQVTLEEQGSEIGVEFSLGAGEYPILALPITENGLRRVDGSTFANDVRVNRGSSFGLNFQWQSSKSGYPLRLSAAWSRIATAPGVGLPTPASYSRLSLGLGSNIKILSETLELCPAIEARRSMYQNVDSGHFIDAILVQTKLSRPLSRFWSVDLAYSYAPWTKFGLLQTMTATGSGSLRGAETHLRELALATHYKASSRTEFLATVTQESASVQLDNADGYLAYGLPVAMDPKLNTRKSYNLSVRQLTLGTVTHF